MMIILTQDRRRLLKVLINKNDNKNDINFNITCSPNDAQENMIKLLPAKSSSDKKVESKDKKETRAQDYEDKELKLSSNSPPNSIKKEDTKNSSLKNNQMVKLKTHVEGLAVKVDNDALNKSFNKSMRRQSTVSSKVVDDDDFEEESHADKNVGAHRRLSRMSSKLSSMSKTK